MWRCILHSIYRYVHKKEVLGPCTEWSNTDTLILQHNYDMTATHIPNAAYNESTEGADASLEVPKLKLLTMY